MARKKSQPLTRSELMQRVKNKDSAAEISFRKALHKRGLRFFLQRRIEKVTVDIVFPVAKIAVLIDGCFWHGCPIHATYPKTNTAYWLPKLAKNKERDDRQTRRLQEAGWLVYRVWEHECLPASESIVDVIAKEVTLRRSSETRL